MRQISYRRVEPVTVYAARIDAPGPGPDNVGPAIATVMPAFNEALIDAGRPLLEPGIFWYEPHDDSPELTVHVSFRAEDPPVPGDGYEVVTLPAVDTMAVLVHAGDMTGIGDSWGRLMEGVAADGYRIVGPCREVYLEAGDPEPGPDWVTELQAPVERG
ncbi:hypothetical protein JOD63_001606 [Microbacterium terrae]|uniref:Bacterial transcription activator, effector binding domain n=1 Tax=Microbacterium terrae TaxID=69369 RepID=A0A0M2HB74_9MICO|nr:GyrI-like domain-containing protein [Microbacterium terrae]KJL41324.1 Bacterial transcription activator, effector binding domain [Microbacterium terrae]MBP1077638.1 hypothetical protein [Microbacterium terrae]GLJ99243.1 hypothetical protein GCM10017594_24400 [Microbacterium terrae]